MLKSAGPGKRESGPTASPSAAGDLPIRAESFIIEETKIQSQVKHINIVI